MTPGYILWYMHSKRMLSGLVAGSYLNPEHTNAMGGSTEQGGDMHAMLRDAFDMHDVREDINFEPQAVNEGAAEGDTLKYYELLKKADKPLQGSTKHNKLSVTIHFVQLEVHWWN